MPFGLGLEVRQAATGQKGGRFRERAKVQSTKENILRFWRSPKRDRKEEKGEGESYTLFEQGIKETGCTYRALWQLQTNCRKSRNLRRPSTSSH